MNERKQGRIAQAQQEANARRSKAIRSLAHCLGRSDVMRYHHNGLVHELLEGELGEQFTAVKAVRRGKRIRKSTARKLAAALAPGWVA
ncbi:MAG: hypothetical protein ABL993_08515 [Vicinamibacterales bacterium]